MSNGWQGYNPTYIGIDYAVIKYSTGDRVRITEQFDPNYGMIGTILRHDEEDSSYLIEFEYNGGLFGSCKNTDWYCGTEDFVHANKPTYATKETSGYYCRHEWREDKWFTSKVFKTCKLCGAKAEDV